MLALWEGDGIVPQETIAKAREAAAATTAPPPFAIHALANVRYACAPSRPLYVRLQCRDALQSPMLQTHVHV